MAKESFMEDFTNLLNDVSFSTNAKKDTFISNVKFFRYKADQKIRQNPSDSMAIEKGFINQVNTLVNKLENEHTILKSGADKIRTGIGYILMGEKPEVSKKVQIQATVKKQESVNNEEPKVEEVKSSKPEVVEKPVVEKPQVEIKPEETPVIDQVVSEAMKNCESITIDHSKDTKPEPGESQEEFQKRMDAFVNDPAVLNSAIPVETNDAKDKLETGEEIDEPETVHERTVESTSVHKTETASSESDEEKEITDSKEDPVNQGSFQVKNNTESNEINENEDPYDQAFVDHISFDDEPDEPEEEVIDNSENEESETTDDETVTDDSEADSEEEYYEEPLSEEDRKKANKEKVKQAAKVAATIIIPLTIGFGMGYVLGKCEPKKEDTQINSSELVKNRFKKR